MTTNLQLHLRSHVLEQNAQGWNVWREVTTECTVAADRTAIIICDMWDKHWSRGAVERVEIMLPRMEATLTRARKLGVAIVHAPSETMAFYAEHPARQRILALAPIAPPPDRAVADPPLPIDDADGGSDTGETEHPGVWTRQHPGLTIDDERDVISDNGREIYSFFRHRGYAVGVIADMVGLTEAEVAEIINRRFDAQPGSTDASAPHTAISQN